MRVFWLYSMLFRAILSAARTPKVQALILFCLLIGALQAAIFMIVEDWTFLQGFYFAIVTMATVGYGDVTPETALGKLVAVAFMFFGIGIFVLAFSAFAQAFMTAVDEIGTRDASSPDLSQGLSPGSGVTETISIDDREVRRVTTD